MGRELRVSEYRPVSIQKRSALSPQLFSKAAESTRRVSEGSSPISYVATLFICHWNHIKQPWKLVSLKQEPFEKVAVRCCSVLEYGRHCKLWVWVGDNVGSKGVQSVDTNLVISPPVAPAWGLEAGRSGEGCAAPAHTGRWIAATPQPLPGLSRYPARSVTTS